MSPAEECRRRYAEARRDYASALLSGQPIKAGNIARRMAKLRKAAWSIKILEDRARMKVA
ncbi:MAG TPA: hypothetical protein VJ798_08890 [Rhizomicrobium sp.]|nr:hypothetical protein [Rhizomicrobium sp.]